LVKEESYPGVVWMLNKQHSALDKWGQLQFNNHIDTLPGEENTIGLAGTHTATRRDVVINRACRRQAL
jgi:hypothetical protein